MKWLNSLFKIENKCLNHVVMNIFYDRTGIYRKQRITALNIHGLELTAFKIRFYSYGTSSAAVKPSRQWC